MSQTAVGAEFAGTGEFVGLLIVKLAQTFINESHKCCSESVFSQSLVISACTGLMEIQFCTASVLKERANLHFKGC